MAAAVEELPEELMTLILLKLPVKSLLRCKCVQKSWYSLIKSPHFVHLHRSSSSNNCFIVRRFIKKKKQQKNVLSLHSYETLADLDNDKINLPKRFFTLCGSCDGLVCLTNCKDQILICNPTIREFRSLFVPHSLDYHIDSIVFGSDPNTGQYFLVMVGMHYRSSIFYAVENSDREVRLYDFSTDTWRETTAVVLPGQRPNSCRAVLFNGAFHWCTRDRGSILSFHMSNEVTGSIPLPDFVDVSSHRMELCVSTKSHLLSLILYDYYLGGGRFEICVMAEYGVKESWTSLFKIGPLQNIFTPIAFWDEQRLLLETGGPQLVSCDLKHQNLRYFKIYGNFDLYPYSPSLVSVNGIGHPNPIA